MKLIPFSDADFASLYEFMSPLWHDTYDTIIPPAQVDLLLDKYFGRDGLAHFRALGYEYYNIDNAGVLVCVEKADSIYIDKLYLRPSARGKGYPAFVFNELIKRGKDLTLNANRENKRAVACYLKCGFVIESETDIDVGGGFVNRDYTFRKKCK